LYFPRSHRPTLFLAIAIALFCLAACASRTSAAQTVIDDLGRRLVLPNGASRIVALDPTAVEVLYAVGGGSRLVGVSNYTDYPSAARSLPTLDGLDPSRETLAALRPDLIIITDQLMTARSADEKSRLWRAPLFVSSSGSYAAVERNWLNTAPISGMPLPLGRRLKEWIVRAQKFKNWLRAGR